MEKPEFELLGLDRNLSSNFHVLTPLSWETEVSFELVDTGWDKVLHKAVRLKCKALKVVCPFIKVRTAQRLLEAGCPQSIQIITRFHLGEMAIGVSDTEAFRLLLDNGAEIRGISNLHSKLYIFGGEKVIVTSANLTESALLRNHEFGFVSSKGDIIEQCDAYFSSLWKRAGVNLDLPRLERWEEKIKRVRVGGTRPAHILNLPDEGVDASLNSAQPFISELSTPSSAPTPQAFVKFFGEAKQESRASREKAILQEVSETGCHWACSYPGGLRPRQVQDGAVMFMGRLAEGNDILIFGRAVGLAHVEGRDEASRDEIERRPWKETWSNYIRVHSGEFLAGTLRNGISLNEMMAELGSDAFITTQRNARTRNGNTNPRAAYKQKPGVQLTDCAFDWLNARLEVAFLRAGKIAKAELDRLDWPKEQVADAGIVAHLNEYERWLRSNRRKANTAKQYAHFLKRCATHYGVNIDEKIIARGDAEALIRRVAGIVKAQGRTTKGTFNRRDVTQNLGPALNAYAQFISTTRDT